MLILEEAPSLHVKAYNMTTSAAVIAWKPLQGSESSVIDVSGYRVSLKSKYDKTQVKLVNTNISSLFFEDLKTFTNYCASVEPMTALVGMGKDDCYYFITQDDSKSACFLL